MMNEPTTSATSANTPRKMLMNCSWLRSESWFSLVIAFPVITSYWP